MSGTIDLTNAKPCPDCWRMLTTEPKCCHCTERDALRAELAAAKEERDQLAADNARLRAALQPFADRIKAYPPWMWTAMVEREKQGVITGGFTVGGEAVTHMPAMLLVQAEEALAATPDQSIAAHDAALLRRLAAESAPGERADIAPWLLAEADRIEKEAANGQA